MGAGAAPAASALAALKEDGLPAAAALRNLVAHDPEPDVSELYTDVYR